MTWISVLWPTLLLLASFAATIALVVAAATTSRGYLLWAAAFTSWLGSFLGSFSIGLLTLVVTFVLLALALAHSLGWLTSAPRAGLAVGCGVVSWWVLVHTVDDSWLFFPLNRLLELLLE